MPAVSINILFSLIYGLKMFDLVLILTSGGPGHDTETLGTLILSEMSRGRWGQSVAINMLFTILLVVVGAVSRFGFENYYPIMIMGLLASGWLFIKFSDIGMDARIPDKRSCAGLS